MTIDWWTLGLQAANLLILMWLLSRVFWRPVAGAIAKRKETVQATLDAAKTAQAKADAALVEVTKTRKGIAAERNSILNAAKEEADAASKAMLAQAQEKIGKNTAAAQLALARDTEILRKKMATQAAELSIEIAEKLLKNLNASTVQTAFLDALVTGVKNMPPKDRTTLTDSTDGINLVSAADLEDADKETITKAITRALGTKQDIRFATDPDLIAGLEIHTPHFILHNSWQSDLARIQREMKDAI
ncbi:F0F1 ATP synthase subunit delta [uncultured Thalassospira sp.]|uniref:F0F1 ATP synthase subunit delta n=1 Tax=uncultured Thalassospira sp. TaxID=404382 RepID=UPI0030DA46E9|tara:strand:- start:2035 stop:2772 length:738 start_codon:yes stop_codon:yes gene_type:complete